MEKQPHQEYRDDLAEKLKEIRNSDPENPEIAKAEARGYLDAKQETEKYISEKDKHQAEVKEEIAHKEKIKEMERQFSLKAEERLPMFMDYLRSKNENLSESVALEGLKAIDEAYENGLMFSPGIGSGLDRYMRIMNYAGVIDNFAEGIKHEELNNVLEDIYNRYKKISEVIGKYNNDLNYSNTPLVRQTEHSYDRNGEGGWGPGQTEAEQIEVGTSLEERIRRITKFLEKFRKSPEQIAKEHEEKRLKVENEKSKEQLEKFDPQI